MLKHLKYRPVPNYQVYTCIGGLVRQMEGAETDVPTPPGHRASLHAPEVVWPQGEGIQQEQEPWWRLINYYTSGFIVQIYLQFLHKTLSSYLKFWLNTCLFIFRLTE